jgi:hypothetical protein
MLMTLKAKHGNRQKITEFCAAVKVVVVVQVEVVAADGVAAEVLVVEALVFSLLDTATEAVVL